MSKLNVVSFGLLAAVLTLVGCQKSEAAPLDTLKGQVSIQAGYENNGLFDLDGVRANVFADTNTGVRIGATTFIGSTGKTKTVSVPSEVTGEPDSFADVEVSDPKFKTVGAYLGYPIAVNQSKTLKIVPYIGAEHYRQEGFKDVVGNVGVQAEYNSTERFGVFAGARYDSEFGSDAKNDTSYNVGVTARFW